MAVTDGTTTGTDGVLPNQGIYQQRKAEAEAAYQRALANLSHKRSGILQDYGFQADFDEEGNVSEYGIDPGNEYGILQMSRRSQASDLDSAQEESRLRGFSKRGFGAQAEKDTRYAHGAQNMEIGRGFLDSIYGAASEQKGAVGAKNAAFLGIEQEQMYEALANRLFNEAPEADEEAGPDPGEMPTIKWGGADRTKDSLTSHLQGKGVNPKYWAWKHRGAAKRLGMKVPGKEPVRTVKQRNANRLETVMLNRRRKKGWRIGKLTSHPQWKQYVKAAGVKKSTQLLQRLYPAVGNKKKNRRRRR